MWGHRSAQRVFILFLGALAAAASASGQRRPSSDARALTGIVVDAREGTPLRRARVSFVTGSRSTDAVYTDDEGRFTLEIPARPASPVRSAIRATKAGYALHAVDVPPAADLSPLRFALVRAAAVSGIVRDPYGVPIAFAYVTARALRESARTSAFPAGQFFVQTDTLGEYRLGGLPAGAYQIVAIRLPATAEGVDPESRLFGPPDGLDVSTRVSEVSLNPGDEMTALDFVMASPAAACPVRPVSLTAGTGVIQGRVVSTSGEPVPCANVVVASDPAERAVALTDSLGRYSLSGLPAGDVVPSAGRVEFVSLRHGQRHPADPETPVRLQDGGRARADFVLPLAGLISGTVRDEHGEPMDGVLVRAIRIGPTDGVPAAMAGLPDQTDDRGRFRLTGLNSGMYVVATLPTQTGTVWMRDGRTRGYVAGFHADPSTEGPRAIALDVGERRDEIDIGLWPSALTSVSGTLVGSAGRPLSGLVELFENDPDRFLFRRSASAGGNGQFSFDGVPAGEYVLKATVSSGAWPELATQRVRVDASPVAVTLVARQGASVSGRVTLDGPTDPADAGLMVIMSSTDTRLAPGIGLIGVGAGRGTSTVSDGRFHIGGLFGSNRLGASWQFCETCYLKSVVVRGVDALTQPFDFGLAGEAFEDADIVISDAGATLEGRAHEGERRAIAFSVIAFATDPALWYPRSQYVKVAAAHGDGVFRLPGLPPGEYHVLAVNRLETPWGVSVSDPEALERLRARGARVTVSERDRRSLDLRLQRH